MVYKRATLKCYELEGLRKTKKHKWIQPVHLSKRVPWQGASAFRQSCQEGVGEHKQETGHDQWRSWAEGCGTAAAGDKINI
jgi:hypothetical protein